MNAEITTLVALVKEYQAGWNELEATRDGSPAAIAAAHARHHASYLALRAWRPAAPRVGEAERLRRKLVEALHTANTRLMSVGQPIVSADLTDAEYAALASPAPQPAAPAGLLAKAVSDRKRLLNEQADKIALLTAPAPVEPPPAKCEPFSNPEEFDPGIRDVVIRLNEAGFKTTDSGDGVSKAEAIAAGDALPFRHVACVVPRVALFSEADRLLAILGAGWTIEASYHPPEGHCLLFASDATVEGGQA